MWVDRMYIIMYVLFLSACDDDVLMCWLHTALHMYVESNYLRLIGNIMNGHLQPLRRTSLPSTNGPSVRILCLHIRSISYCTPGPIYFSVLITAEVLGPTGTAQIVDLNANNGNIYTPAYAVYEKGSIARVALFNYVTDATGGNTYTASIAVGGGQSGQPNGSPPTVKVKCVLVILLLSRPRILTLSVDTYLLHQLHKKRTSLGPARYVRSN